MSKISSFFNAILIEKNKLKLINSYLQGLIVMKSIKFFYLIFSFCVVSAAVRAAVAPEYADNSYSNHELTRAEKKCLDEGYKITYANCSNQTAPADQCPHHKSYYRTCSQEQWCRNNNFRF